MKVGKCLTLAFSFLKGKHNQKKKNTKLDSSRVLLVPRRRKTPSLDDLRLTELHIRQKLLLASSRVTLFFGFRFTFLQSMATFNLLSGTSVFKSEIARVTVTEGFASVKNVNELFFSELRSRENVIPPSQSFVVNSSRIKEQFHVISNRSTNLASANGPSSFTLEQSTVDVSSCRKTKIVCTIGPSSSSREMIWKLAEAGMNVARLNMSHGDHASHKKTIDLVKEYNAQFEEKVIAIMLDTKGPEVRSGDVPQPIILCEGQEFNFTIERGVSTENTVSVNYDDFVNDVEVGDTLLVDGGMMSLVVKSKTKNLVKCEVVDGGELKSRRHLNVRGKSATLPSITDRDWEDIKFGVDNQVDFYAVSFIKDAKVVHQLKDYLKGRNADIHVIVKIESADSIPNLHSILSASDGAMVARGDLGAELPIEEVPLLQEDIIKRCRSMCKPVIVATNMLESMIDHPTPTRAEVSDIAIAVREGADAVMLSGETAHGKHPLKAVKVMHNVALRTESRLPFSSTLPVQSAVYKGHMGEMFAFHSTIMANTLMTPIIVFTRTGSMAVLLSHYRPSSTIFAFTNSERLKQRLVLYHGVMPIFMKFSDDAEETFSRALRLLLDKGLMKEGQYVTLVQSGAQPIWREESTHHIQVRRIQG